MTVDCSACPLRKGDAFETLSPDGLAFMQKFKVGELQVDAGTTLLMEGSNAPQLYTALEGLGLRHKLLPDGRRQVVNFVMPGSFIGLQAGVMGEMQHSVEATTSMLLCVFDRAELWTLFKSQPARAFDLTWIAAMEEHFLGQVLASVGQMTAMERMCFGLLQFYSRCEDIGLVKGGRCPFPYRQQDLADALGLSLVHTNKTLMKLREGQVLSLTDGFLTLHNPQKIRDLAVVDVARHDHQPLI